jgi:hypothetical protein
MRSGGSGCLGRRHQAAAFTRCRRCSFFRSFRQRSLQTKAPGCRLWGSPQTTQARVGTGCSARYSARRLALYSARYSGFSARHCRTRSRRHSRHQLSRPLFNCSFGANASSGSQCWPALHHLPRFVFKSGPPGFRVRISRECLARGLPEGGLRSIGRPGENRRRGR